MHAPKPYGIGVSGDAPTDRDSAFIANCVRKISNFKNMSGVDTIKYTRALPDGGFVIIHNSYGLLKAIVLKEPKVKPVVKTYGLALPTIPMLFSGVFTKTDALIKTEGVELTLTKQCAKRLAGYDHTIHIPVKQKLHRFRCEYSLLYKELEPEAAKNFDPDTLLFTQYGNHVPSWYSGAMAEVVQIVSGFGSQEKEKLPDETIERMDYELPPATIKRVEAEILGSRLPAYKGLPDEKGQLQYSYTFFKTHLVSFDDGNNPWLIQIDSSGVWAMPLPVVPASTTQAFRDYVERQVYDEELKLILERFKGIPTGEVFPIGSAFHHWVRAGVIIKICDTKDFYSKSAYSSAMGWTANTDGTEVSNTCYDYEDYYCIGYTYSINLKLGQAKNNGVIPSKSTAGLTDLGTQKVSKYLSALYDIMDLTSAAAHAVMYKMRRVSPMDILNRTINIVDINELNYWINLELEPIASHSGNMILEDSGNLWDGTSLKFPEPAFKGCVNMQFSGVAPAGVYRPLPDRIDTTVFVYYVGDDKKVVKNFKDTRPSALVNEDGYEDVMILGYWEKFESRTPMSVEGNYYSTDFDFRQQLAESTFSENTVGTDLGYGKPFMFFSPFWMSGYLRRSRYYQHVVTARYTYGNKFYVAATVPYLNRNALLFVTRKSMTSQRDTVESYRRAVSEPWHYAVWTFDEGAHWAPWGLTAENGLSPRKGIPYPANARPVWAESKMISSNEIGPYADFANSGDWVDSFPADVTHFYGSDGTPPDYEKINIDVTNKNPEIESTLHCSIVNSAKQLSDKAHSSGYYDASPQGNYVLYDDACQIFFGTSSYANISYNMTERKSFGYSGLADKTRVQNFFGVINE